MSGLILVSACLAGVKCRYDGKSNEVPEVVRLLAEGRALPVCPEQLGGLPTPRTPAEIVGERVMTAAGEDVTRFFVQGAEEAFRICRLAGCRTAVLKARSPSCGCGQVYDGGFSGNLVEGDGVFVRVLKEDGVEVVTEKDEVELNAL